MDNGIYPQHLFMVLLSICICSSRSVLSLEIQILGGGWNGKQFGSSGFLWEFKKPGSIRSPQFLVMTPLWNWNDVIFHRDCI